VADTNGDGVISLDEMTQYLESVFRVAYDTVPGTRERVGVTPEQLAAATAAQCFADADADGNGTIDIDEFTAWFGLTGGEFPFAPSAAAGGGAAGAASGTSSRGAPGAGKAAQAAEEESGDDETVSQHEVRTILGLDQYDVQEVFSTFQEHAEHGSYP
jgi:hypothetical protein